MTLYKYRVQVPFKPFVSEGFGGTSTSGIGPGVEHIGDISIEHLGERTVAVVEVVADAPGRAKTKAADIVGALVRLFALGNHPFVIEFSRVKETSLGVAEGRPPGAELFFVGEAISISQTLNNVAFEDGALVQRQRWPVHIRRALDLNYASVLNRERDVRFLLSAAALEVAAFGKIDPPKGLLKAVLGPRYSDFKSSLTDLLEEYSLGDLDAKRVKSRVLETHLESPVNGIHAYLSGVSKGQNLDDIAEWWRIRGILAHGKQVDEDRLKKHLGDLQAAQRGALVRDIVQLTSSNGIG